MLKVQEVREIIRLIDESSINEFTYETTNGTKIKMKKNTDIDENSQLDETKQTDQSVMKTESKSVEQIQKVHKEEVISETEEENDQQVEETSVDYDYEIVSPMVGTFYQAPSPESDPYVGKNSEVENDTIVCIVEAMKLFNEIEAEVSGTIVDILVEDGELVEYGQPLFRVKQK